MAQEQIEAFAKSSDPFFGRQRALIVALADRYALPAGYSRREFVDAGGLMSYGPSLRESWRRVGEYAGPHSQWCPAGSATRAVGRTSTSS